MDIFQKSLGSDFDEIAQFVLNGCLLKTKEKTYSICEIEFYLTNNDHNDPYTHKKEEQKGFGGWYFHKHGGGYREGTFKGLDITFSKDGYGGILIRSIKDDSVVEGPCNVVNKLCNKIKVCEFVKEFEDFKVENKNNPIWLESCHDRKEKFYTSIRVGLKNSHPEWRSKPYRYTTIPHKIKKCANDVVNGMKDMGLSKEEIEDIMTEGGKRRRRINL